MNTNERIQALFHLLQCNNTQIAHYAGCSQSHISRLRSGKRSFSPKHEMMLRFAQAVYSYAREEELLPVLMKLLRESDDSEETVTKALIAWLYDTNAYELPESQTPKSREEGRLAKESFGQRLSLIQSSLGISNVALASMAKTDSSLISHYRSGYTSAPKEKTSLYYELPASLYSYAQRTMKEHTLARLLDIPEEELSAEKVLKWLYDNNKIVRYPSAEMVFHFIDNYAPSQPSAGSLPAIPDIEIKEHYRGAEGLRAAVIRFLAEASRTGGRLCLYSDESMEWMSEDPKFRSIWSFLMAACIQNGVKIRIIHNMNRSLEELSKAIIAWFPLYVIGGIEPYVSRSRNNERFRHTIFLHEKNACISSFSPIALNNQDDRWYNYITDTERLRSVQHAYDSMLENSSSILKVYTAENQEVYRNHLLDNIQTLSMLLFTPPLWTMPEELFSRIMNRLPISNEKKNEIREDYRRNRDLILSSFEDLDINIFLCPMETGEDNDLPKINFSHALLTPGFPYTREEYEEHLASLPRLSKRIKGIRFTSLRTSPFQKIQIIAMKRSVIIVCKQTMIQAVEFFDYNLARTTHNFLHSLADIEIGR